MAVPSEPIKGARPNQRSRAVLRLCAGPGLVAVLGIGLASEAHAVVTITNGYTGTRTLTLRVGTATTGSVDTVQFNVGNTPTGNSLPTGTAVNGNGTPIAASSGGVFFSMLMRAPAGNIPQQMTTTVTSPVALTCLSGGCGSASIPFSTISWVVAPAPSGQYATFDLQNGTFAGGTTQQLLGFFLINGAGSAEVAATMNFSYANATPFPAGTYSGTVVYTATLP